MNTDFHERARMLIALSGSELASNADHTWLRTHLESCAACREFAESSRATILLLRAFPITAGGTLVSSTRTRVHQRAQELQRRQEWLWMIGICCSAVTLCAACTTAAVWRGFAWLGLQARIFPPVWQVGFLALYLMPSILVGILLLARGTHFTMHDGG